MDPRVPGAGWLRQQPTAPTAAGVGGGSAGLCGGGAGQQPGPGLAAGDAPLPGNIDQRLREQQRRRQEAQRAATISPAGAPSPQSAQQRFLYCRLHQSEIQAAESERQRRQSIWAVVSRQEAPGSISYNEARATYEDSINTLERLIPEAMRDGQPLIPDSIRRFMSCDFP